MIEKQERLRELLKGIDETGENPVQVDGIDFSAFRKEFMAAVDVSKIRRLFALGEKNDRLYAKKDREFIKKCKEAKGRGVAMDLKARVECERVSIKELLETQEFDQLNTVFEDYYRVQLGEDFIGEKVSEEGEFVLIPLEDELFIAAVFTLFYTERFESACQLLHLREKTGVLTSEMKVLLEDMEKLKKAVENYENKAVQEAEELSRELLEKYPGNRSLMKLQSRFYMGRAMENRREAERFINDCLKLFPDDGYFMKYKADLLWINGSCQDALILYAEAKKHTLDMAPLMEMERLFLKCKQEVLDTCLRLLEYRAREEAGRLMELWKKLMPQDEEVEACLWLTRVECARTQGELEGILEKILPEVEKEMISSFPSEKESEEGAEETQEEPGSFYYKKALTRAWRRLGYHEEMAQLYTKVKCTSEESELEWLAEEIRSHQIKKELRAEAFKLVGDVRMKQGQTKAAFENYRNALEVVRPSYIKTELIRRILTDLSCGDQRLRLYAKKSDATPFLDSWLGKYGTLEDICGMISKLV